VLNLPWDYLGMTDPELLLLLLLSRRREHHQWLLLLLLCSGVQQKSQAPCQVLRQQGVTYAHVLPLLLPLRQ
jgi:hypothetical protein